MFANLSPHLTYFLRDFAGYLIVDCLTIILFIFVSYKFYKSALTPNMKRTIVAVSFTIFILVFIYSFAEAYFRYVYDEPDGLGFLKVNQKWQQRHVQYTFYDKIQFRDDSFDTKIKDGVARIGVLGDSITFGGGIENPKERFSDLLASKLKNVGYKAEVFNLGKPGFDTEAEIEVYKKVSELNFDIVIWQYFLNDIQSAQKSTGRPIIQRSSQRVRLIEFISGKSYFFDYLYWRISARYQKTFEELKEADLALYRDPEILDAHRAQINTFIKELEEQDKKVIVIIFPSLFFLGPNYPAEDIHGIMSSIFAENGVEVIDLLETLRDKKPKDLIASRFDAHPNEYVHSVAAEMLFEKVAAQLR